MKKLKLVLLPICLFAFNLCNLSAASQSPVAAALGFKANYEIEKFLNGIELYYDSFYYLSEQTLTSNGENADAAIREVNKNDFNQTLNMFVDKIFSEEDNPEFAAFAYDLRTVIEYSKNRTPMPGKSTGIKDAKERILKFQKEYENAINKFLENNSAPKPDLKK